MDDIHVSRWRLLSWGDASRCKYGVGELSWLESTTLEMRLRWDQAHGAAGPGKAVENLVAAEKLWFKQADCGDEGAMWGPYDDGSPHWGTL